MFHKKTLFSHSHSNWDPYFNEWIAILVFKGSFYGELPYGWFTFAPFTVTYYTRLYHLMPKFYLSPEQFWNDKTCPKRKTSINLIVFINKTGKDHHFCAGHGYSSPSFFKSIFIFNHNLTSQSWIKRNYRGKLLKFDFPHS